jgi:hypothetical protein
MDTCIGDAIENATGWRRIEEGHRSTKKFQDEGIVETGACSEDAKRFHQGTKTKKNC